MGIDALGAIGGSLDPFQLYAALPQYKGLGMNAIGGGAKSAPWMQLKADLLGKPVHAMRVSESVCLPSLTVSVALNRQSARKLTVFPSSEPKILRANSTAA